MNFFMSFALVLLFTFSNCALSQKINDDKFAAKIKDCIFVEENSTESVKLICDNEVTYQNQMTEYAKDNCYSILFEDESKDDNRSKVMNLETGRCRTMTFDGSLATLFPNLISLDISYLGFVSYFSNPIIGQYFNFKSLIKLDASYNSMYELNAPMFNYTKNITEIDFSYNHIKSISSTCFNDLINLAQIIAQRSPVLTQFNV